MEAKLNIKGLFKNEQELFDAVKRRRICYDTEPYYVTGRGGSLLQIGYQINLYAAMPGPFKDATPDSPDYTEVERDVVKLAEALSNTCNPVHMCESTTIDPSTITYSQDRGMRPDLTVHIPLFDQSNFGHPVDDRITGTLHEAIRLLEYAGVHKTRWQE
ncbi:MAG: hypothetical protein ACYC69_01615 [Thermodesulfovibrionales bacterium]